MCQKNKVVAIIPAYNEENKIEDTIKELKKIKLINEIIVVDDGSRDNTYEKAIKSGVNVVKLDKNHGKGYAIKTGLSNTNASYIVLLDGDLGKTSNEVEKLLLPVLNKECDFTIARFKNTNKKGGFGFVKKIAKLGVYFYTKIKIDSTLSGQRVYKIEVLKSMDYIPNNYGIEVAMTIQALKKNYILKEVDVDMKHNETGNNLSGFLHRGRQFLDIAATLFILIFRIRS